jgi:hypothetical protein
MDFWKFNSILEKQALYFSTIASQLDKLEGSHSLSAKINRARGLYHLTQVQQGYALHNLEVMDQISTHEIIISCWHINETENNRMWCEYITSSEGVAIQTSDDALRESFVTFSHPQLIHIENV